jgi:hypothetical protein
MTIDYAPSDVPGTTPFTALRLLAVVPNVLVITGRTKLSSVDLPLAGY